MQSSPEVSRGDMLRYAHRIETDLVDNVLPFWLKHAPMPTGTGFIGALTNDLKADPTADRGMLLSARILWTFAAAYRRYGRSAYLSMAHRAYSDLRQNFRDPRHGGYVWAISANGNPVRERKQVYGQAFALYAFVEYYIVTKKSEALEEAVALFMLIETHARDLREGGYIEAFDRTWRPVADMRLSEMDLNAPKSQNTHLHVIEAYAALLRIWPDKKLRGALQELLEIMLTRIVDGRNGHLGLFFSRDWASLSGDISYGHEIEASWLLTDASDTVGHAELTERVTAWATRIAQTTLEEGVDTDGALFNQGNADGVVDDRKEWWPQAEAIVGFLNAAQLTGSGHFLQAALRAWDFIEHSLVDREHGEWLRGVARGGGVLSDQHKISFWKCPYHNGRAALEATSRLRSPSHPAQLTT